VTVFKMLISSSYLALYSTFLFRIEENQSTWEEQQKIKVRTRVDMFDVFLLFT
jgi:hypothetical protein